MCSCAAVTLPCSLSYFYKSKKYACLVTTLFLVIYLMLIAFILPSLVICIFFEFIRFLGWLLSCFYCFKRKECKFRNIKSKPISLNQFKPTPPYDHQQILENNDWGNKSSKNNLFFKFINFFFLSKQSNTSKTLKKISIIRLHWPFAYFRDILLSFVVKIRDILRHQN